jgi:type III pantothenate kinase
MTLRALLLVDAGNSALKWQLLVRPESELSDAQHAMELVTQSPVHRQSNADVSVEGLLSAWQQAAKQITAETLGSSQWQIAWCSVGPVAVQQVVKQTFKRLTGSDPPPPFQSQLRADLIGVSCETVLNRYTNPGQLGVDRWVSAIGLAAQGVTGPNETHMVISAGTATTVDLMHHESSPDASATDGHCLSFLGGWILPGIRLMNSALRSQTRDLDYTVATHGAIQTEIPRDSQTAITQGIGLAQTGFVAGLIRHHHVTKIWLHGGQAQDWRHFLAELDQDTGPMVTVHEQPSLLFAGLLTLARFCR